MVHDLVHVHDVRSSRRRDALLRQGFGRAHYEREHRHGSEREHAHDFDRGTRVS